MRFQLPDGKIVMMDRDFVYQDTQYPPGWLRMATPAERAALGLVELPEPEAPNTPAPPVVPASITRRQLILALLAGQFITPVEAELAATTGAVPAMLDQVLAALTPEQALAARITWATMSVAERSDPLIQAVIDAGLATAEQVDAVFIAGGAL